MAMKTSLVVVEIILLVIVLIFTTVMFLSDEKLLFKKIMPLLPKSAAVEGWMDPPADIYMKFSFFETLNPDQVLSGGKAQVVEHGPFAYREYRKKNNVEHQDNNKNVYYEDYREYFYDESVSVGDVNQRFTMLNAVPALFMGYFTRMENNTALFTSSMLTFISEELFVKSNTQLFIDLSPHELLWGYNDQFLTYVKNYDLSAIDCLQPPSPLNRIECTAVKTALFGVQALLADVNTENLGFYQASNGTASSNWKLDSGKMSLAEIVKIREWNGKGRLENALKQPYWLKPYANEFAGTDGSQFHPFIKKDERLDIFSSDVCRSAYLTFDRVEKLNGLEVWVFTAPAELLEAPAVNEDNQAYCYPDAESCYGQGVQPLDPCYGGMPVTLSLPHFLDAGVEYSGFFSSGMNPQRAIHEIYASVEPLIGASFRVANRIQINSALWKTPAFSQLSQLGQDFVVYPIFWVEESAHVNDQTIEDTKVFVQLLPALEITSIVLITTASCIFLGILFHTCIMDVEDEGELHEEKDKAMARGSIQPINSKAAEAEEAKPTVLVVSGPNATVAIVKPAEADPETSF